DFQADLGDRESLLLISSAALSLGGLALSPFGHFLVPLKFSLNLHKERHGAAVLSSLDLGLDLDGQVLFQEGFACVGDDVTGGALGCIDGSLELNAGIGLALSIGRTSNGFTDTLKGFGLWKRFSSLISSSSSGEAKENLSLGRLGNVK
ncbi:unnamed protein product, partial [Allacma fusca]